MGWCKIISRRAVAPEQEEVTPRQTLETSLRLHVKKWTTDVVNRELDRLAREGDDESFVPSLPEDAPHEHLLKGIFSSVQSNCAWLRAVLVDEDMLGAIADIESAITAMMLLSSEFTAAAVDADHETEEWEVDAFDDTAEVFPG